MGTNQGYKSTLHILDLNDFVLLNIFSYLTEFEKFYCSKVCFRFNNIALVTYLDTIDLKKVLNRSFFKHDDTRQQKQKFYAIVKELGVYWKYIQIESNILSSDSILKFVKKFCPNLEHIKLQLHNNESKYILNNLPKKLKTIDISVEYRCKEKWLTPLRDCVNVENLILNFTSFNKKNLRADFLQNLPNLKVLIFNNCRPSDRGLKKCFQNSSKISSLELNCDLVSASNTLIELISSKLPNLQRIKLQPIQSFRLDKLGLIPSLKYLTLDSYIPNDINSLLRNLISANNVQCLKLDNCRTFIHNEIIADIYRWTSLRYLHVDYMESFDDRFLRQLAKSGSLNYFHYTGKSRNVTVPEMINLMKRSVNLEIFDFHIYHELSDSFIPDTKIDVEYLKEFRKSTEKQIKFMEINNTTISVHCSGAFCVKEENTLPRSFAKKLNLDLSIGSLGI